MFSSPEARLAAGRFSLVRILMQSRYIDLITRELQGVPNPSGAIRAQLYDRLFGAISRAYGKLPDGRENPEFLGMTLAFNDAVATVEGRYDAPIPPGAVARMVGANAAPKGPLAAQYVLFAGVLGTISDIAQPIIQLTVPVAVGSLGVAAALYLLRRVRGDAIGFLRRGTQFCLVLFACCVLWFGAQQFVPQAHASGAVAQLVPGVADIQKSILDRLHGIEVQTTRIGDLLEKQAEEARLADERERAEYESMQQEYEQAQRIEIDARLEQARDRIIAGGYTADTAGLLRAAHESFSYMDDFGRLEIYLSAAELSSALRQEMDEIALYHLRNYTRNRAGNDTAVQVLQQNLEREYRRLMAFRESRSSVEGFGWVTPPHALPAIQADVCKKDGYSIIVSEAALDALCAMSAVEFGRNHQGYFNRYI